MGRRDFSALDDVDIVLSGSMPEGIVFRTSFSEGVRIRVWCMMDEDDMIEELVREFTEITIEERLKNLGCSETLSNSISCILTQLSLNPLEDNVKHVGGEPQMEFDLETWRKFVQYAKLIRRFE